MTKRAIVSPHKAIDCIDMVTGNMKRLKIETDRNKTYVNAQTAHQFVPHQIEFDESEDTDNSSEKEDASYDADGYVKEYSYGSSSGDDDEHDIEEEATDMEEENDIEENEVEMLNFEGDRPIEEVIDQLRHEGETDISKDQDTFGDSLDDVEFGTTKSKMAPVNKTIEQPDDASEYAPSDEERGISALIRLKRQKYKHKYHGLVKQIHNSHLYPGVPALFPDTRQAVTTYIADLHRYNPQKQRWIRKGPAAICLVPLSSGSFRLVAYNLHGPLFVPLNIPAFYGIERAFRVTSKTTALLSTCGLNFMKSSNTDVTVSVVQDYLYKESTILTRVAGSQASSLPQQLSKCSNSTKPDGRELYLHDPKDELVQETKPSIWSFQFPSNIECSKFQENLSYLVGPFKNYLFKKRVQTFTCPMPILNEGGKVIQSKISPYASDTQLVHALASSGFVYIPYLEDSGTVVESFTTQRVSFWKDAGSQHAIEKVAHTECFYCKTPFDGLWKDYEQIVAYHQAHNMAEDVKCPLAFQAKI